MSIMGNAMAIQELTNTNSSFFAQYTFSAISKSGDLGFKYGTVQPTGANPAVNKAIFVHMWQKDPNNTWKIVVDLMKDLP